MDFTLNNEVIAEKRILLKLDNDMTLTAQFNKDGLCNLKDITNECKHYISPYRWIKKNKELVLSLTNEGGIGHKIIYLGKNRGVYVNNKILFAYISDNDAHWKKTLVEMLYCNTNAGNHRGATYYSDGIAISSDMSSWCNQAINNFHMNLYAHDPNLSNQLKAKIIYWLTESQQIAVGEEMILSGRIPGIHMYCKLLNKSVLCFQIVKDYDSICHLLELG